jgi:hypothetical protein
MKRTILLLLLLLSAAVSQAQYQTPGTGRRFTLAQLVAASGGYVTQAGTEWRINDTIRLAPTDTLSITTNETIRVAALALFYVDGTLLVNPPDSVKFTAQNQATPWHNMWFSATAGQSRLRKTIVEYGAGVRVTGANMQLIDCVLRRNVATLVTPGGNRTIGSGALSLSGNRVLVQNCRFVRNARSAVLSASNTATSPIILDCDFLLNNTENGNFPQINLGPGIPGQAVQVERCRIVGNAATNGAGGIALSNLLGGANVTRAVVRRNLVRNNRYGLTVTGNNFSVYITQNLIENNNTNPNAQTGGSGLNFTGNQTQQGVVSRNVLRGNLWGVTVVRSGTTATGGPRISFGHLASADTTDRGFNHLYGNGNGGVVYDFYNNAPDSVRAENNWWGTAVAADIEAHIVHKSDDPTLGFVDYLPFRTQGPLNSRSALPLAVELYPNPAREAATLLLPGTGPVALFLLDAAGRVVRQQQLPSAPGGRLAVPLQGLPAGLYLYRAEQGGRTATGRLAVE